MSSSQSGAAVLEAPPLPFRPRDSPHSLVFWIGTWWPVALGIGVIFCESTTWMGAEHTTGPFRWLFEHLFGPVSDARWDVLHLLIRKSGHFIGYGLIGLAWLRAWWLALPRIRFFADVLLALLGTALIAGWDEWHQSFLPDRTGSPWDVLLDCCGAITMLLATYAILGPRGPTRMGQ